MPNEFERHGEHHLSVFAVLRFAHVMNTADPSSTTTVVRVFPNRDAAERDAARLSELNAEKGYRYVVQATRFARDTPLPGSAESTADDAS